MLADAKRRVKQGRQRRAEVGQDSHVACGHHAALSFVRSRPADVQTVLIETGHAAESLRDAARKAGLRVREIDRAELDRISSGVTHQGAVVVGKPPSYHDLQAVLDPRPELVLVLDGVTDPRNGGAILRSAEAAGVGFVVITRDRSIRLSPALVRTAAGAVERLALVEVVNLARAMVLLGQAGFWRVGLAADGERELFDEPAVPAAPVALVVGAEGAGLRRLTRSACDLLVRIPMAGDAESLNVAVAASVALFEMRRRLGWSPALDSAGVPVPAVRSSQTRYP